MKVHKISTAFLLWVVLLLVSMSSLLAQSSWTRVYDRAARAKANHIERLNDSTILLLGRNNPRNCSSAFLQVWNITGNELWGQENWFIENLIQAVEIQREHIYAAGAVFLNLTDGYDSTLLYISQYNLSGDTLFYHLLVGDLNDIDSIQQWRVVDLDVSSDGQLLIGFPHFFILADTAGNFSEPVSITNSETLIRGYFRSSDSYIMADSSAVMLVDTTGSILQRIAFDAPLLDMQYIHVEAVDLLYVLTTQNIYVLDDSLSISSSLPISPIFSQVQGMGIYENKVFVKGISRDSSRLEIMELNLSLGIDALYDFELGSVDLFRYTPQGFYFTAPAPTVQLEERFSINFQSFNNLEPEAIGENISIEDFDIEIVYIDKVDAPDIDPFIAGYEFNFSVVCKNIGTSIINTVRLFMDLDGIGSFCYVDPLFYRKYRDLKLMPGDSIVLEGSVFQLGNSDNLCVELVNPNARLEPDTTQNFLCKSFNHPELIVSSEELIPSQVKVFPNPVADVLTLERTALGLSDTFIALRDTHGKLVRETSWHNQYLEIEMGDLSPGIYLLVWHEKDTIQTRKIVKK